MTTQGNNHITYGGRTIDFRLVFAARKTMEIAVYPDGQVVVKAPTGTDPQIIRERLHKRARWIERQLNYFDQFEPRTPARRYVGGESHLYLGRRYRLKIRQGGSDQVKLIGGFFYVTVNGNPSAQRVKQLLDQWYLEKAAIRFKTLLNQRLPEFLQIDATPPLLIIRRMRTRWGSLSSKGRLSLNMELIRAPQECIDYVITHELCHLKHSRHDHAFYRCLEQHMPDWQKRKHKLEMALV